MSVNVPGTTTPPKYRLRFFFDYGAGGCLWADNEATYAAFGYGPLDDIIADKTCQLSAETLDLARQLDMRHADYYNKDYPPDPSLWRQDECDQFNLQVDELIIRLRRELSADFEIIDRQERYQEDEHLDEYLKDPKNFRRSN